MQQYVHILYCPIYKVNHHHHKKDSNIGGWILSYFTSNVLFNFLARVLTWIKSLSFQQQVATMHFFYWMNACSLILWVYYKFIELNALGFVALLFLLLCFFGSSLFLEWSLWVFLCCYIKLEWKLVTCCNVSVH